MTDNKRKDWSGEEGHTEAGQAGGDTTAEERGEEFYQQIGSKGGRSTQDKESSHQLTDEDMVEGGRQSHEGGRPSEDE